MMGFSPEVVEEVQTFEETSPDTPWQVVVSNDPVNLIPYVQAIFQKVLKIDEETAYIYTMKVHNEGRCIVYTGGKDDCENKAAILMSFQLWTHVEKASD